MERGIDYLRQKFWIRVAPAVQAGTLELAGLQTRVWELITTVVHPLFHGTHDEVVAERLASELPLLTSVAARPYYELGYTAWRRVGRDGRFSYRGPATADQFSSSGPDTMAGWAWYQSLVARRTASFARSKS